MNASFRVEPAAPHERPPALHLVFQHLAPKERETRVANALALLQRGELDPAGLLVARGRAGLVGAVICTPAPGAGGLIWPPQCVRGSQAPLVEDELVRQAVAWLRQQGVKLCQALLPPEEMVLAAPLLRGGFLHVTTLWYLRHTLELSAVLLAGGERLAYREYPRDPNLFHATLLHTYEGTADCPEVNGVRTIDEIMAGHRAQGDYDPSHWWLALRDGRPVGVLLLTRMPEWEGAWDVSYVGVVPEARRQGVGREMMRKALLEARLAEALQLTLSVDGRNGAAWELYRRLGFETFDQREVFLAVWEKPAGG